MNKRLTQVEINRWAEFVWKTYLKAGPVRVKRYEGRWQIVGNGALVGEGKTLREAWRNAAVNLQT